jgi:restriction endonuclease S subunit
MIPKTETAFESEGSRDGLNDLLSNYYTSKRKKDPEKLKAKTSFVLDVGEKLIEHKKNIAFGHFFVSIMRMGISRGAAQAYMRAFNKFGTCRDVVKNLGAGKLYILMYLKDKDIKTLVEGGTVSGVNLTAIENMPVRKVRNILMKRRLLKPITWRKRIKQFTKHMSLAFSALAGGVK